MLVDTFMKKMATAGTKRHLSGCGLDLDEFETETSEAVPAKQMHLDQSVDNQNSLSDEGQQSSTDMGNSLVEKEDHGNNGLVGFGTIAIHAGLHPERWDMNQVGLAMNGMKTVLFRLFRQFPSRPPTSNQNRANHWAMTIPEQAIPLEMCSRKTWLHWSRADIVSDSQNFFAKTAKIAGRVFSSGLSATAAMANWVNSGGHVILADDGYGGTQRYFRRVCQDKHGIELSFVDLTKVEELKKALKPNTKVVLSMHFFLIFTIFS